MKIDDNHHAYFLQANNIEESSLPTALLKTSIDVYHLSCDSFGIDDARDLLNKSGQKAVSGTKRAFVVCAKKITLEAQNALLKLLEEPPVGAKFYILMSDYEFLIPTLQSRLLVLKGEDVTEESEVFTNFIQLSCKDRLASIAEKMKEKDLEWTNKIVTGAVNHVKGSKDLKKMNSVVFVASHINGPGAAKKMLLEEMALTL